MRASGIVVAMILAIALYFSLFWGFDALRIFTSPTYGLDDVWRSQVVFGLGRFFNLTPEMLLQLAAAYGAVKLVVAAVSAIHVFDRFRSFVFGKADSAIFEGALMLVVILSMLAITPALWSQNADMLRDHVIQLAIAGLAAALCLVERSMDAKRVAAERASLPADMEFDAPMPAAPLELSGVPQREWYSPWRS